MTKFEWLYLVRPYEMRCNAVMHLYSWMRHFLEGLGNLGPTAPLLFILVYILACVAFVPGSVLTLGAGAVFGVLWGTVYVSIGSTLGATAAFLTGRYAAQGPVQRMMESYKKFQAIDAAVAQDGWKIVGLVRLSPIFPFNLVNYAFGLTRVSLRDYFFASWIGMLPATVVYVYIGALVGDVARLGLQGRTRSPAEWILYLIGLAATVAVTIYVMRLAKKALPV